MAIEDAVCEWLEYLEDSCSFGLCPVHPIANPFQHLDSHGAISGDGDVHGVGKLLGTDQQDARPERLHHEQPPLAEALLAVELGAQRLPHRLVQRVPVAVDAAEDVVDDEGRLAAADVRHGRLVVPGLADPHVLAVQPDQRDAAADRVDVYPRVQLADGRVGHLQVGVGGRRLRRRLFRSGVGVYRELVGRGPGRHFGFQILEVVFAYGVSGGRHDDPVRFAGEHWTTGG
ncbi:hypothetical protein PG999_001460 [Apiospora kogelbergensis]|uniref:Uncharacterized protein n=2 Tax=Apiospora kogelbergensis TaxID=1337665 RepID=A0AAW0REC3_9PEZI